MRELVALADQIRVVRAAQKRFMSLWRLEQVLVGPEVLDAVAADLTEVADMADEVLSLAGNDRADRPAPYPRPHRWSMYTDGGGDGLS